MEETIHRVGGRTGSSAQATPEREHPIEAVGSRPDVRQSDNGGCSIKTILKSSRRRQVAEPLCGSYWVLPM
jgi:hypothetical protein